MVGSDSHLMVIEKVFVALDGGDMDKDSNQDEDFLEDEEKNEEMLDDDNPDDSMTLVQYQNEVRCELLIRKGSHTSDSS